MKRTLLLLPLCVWLPACALFQRPPQPLYASPQEAANFTWPQMLPTEGHQTISGIWLAAIQLAMEDFLPWDYKTPKDATPREVCLDKRYSYDAEVSPGPEGVVYVEIFLRPGACEMEGEVLLDAGGIYAIDVKNWRIIAAQR